MNTNTAPWRLVLVWLQGSFLAEIVSKVEIGFKWAKAQTDSLMWTDVSCVVPPALQSITDPSGCKPQEYFPSVYSLQLQQDGADETDLTDLALLHWAVCLLVETVCG